MNKMGAVIITVGLVIAAYLLLLVTMPVIVDIAGTANATAAATSNMSNYPGASGGLLSAPWVLFFVPGAIGIVVVVLILKKR